MRRRITTAGNSAALVLSQDVLGLMGVVVGDEVDITLSERTLVVRPLGQLTKDRKVNEAIDQVFEARRRLLHRLASEDASPSQRKKPRAARRGRRA